MYTSEAKVRVRYGETDKMGYVYYGVYPLYYEVGRTELMRNFDYPYKKMKYMGIMLPLISLQIIYYHEDNYNNIYKIKTQFKDLNSH